MMNKLEILKKKILYRSSYRGTKEMDILLNTFVKKYITLLNKTELNDLDNFLDLDDEIIFLYYKNNQLPKNIKKNKIFDLFKSFKIK